MNEEPKPIQAQSVTVAESAIEPGEPDMTEYIPLDEDDEEVILEAAERNCMAIIPRKGITALSALGIEAASLGLTNVAKGKLIMTITALQEAEQMVAAAMKRSRSVKTILQGGAVMAMLAKASHGCAQAVNANGLASNEKPEKKAKRTFTIVPPAAQKAG